MKQWMKPNNESRSSRFEDSNTNIQLLLGVVGAPLIPFPITSEYKPIITRNIKGYNIVSIIFTFKSFHWFILDLLKKMRI
jgi:hypothetical protein